jgi:hypothetical protein
LQNRIGFVLDSFVTDQPILCLCDRCRAEGRAGAEPFAGLGELLDFEPVPRKARADGWMPRTQRAFIAALALTGSRKAAADAVGMSEGSVTHLLKSQGSESFRAALEAAQRMALDEGRFGGGPRGPHGGEPSGWRRRGGGAAALSAHADPSPDDAEAADKRKEALLDTILVKYILKVSMERSARLAGRIVEADFYLRQLTWLEVALDACADGDGLAELQRLRLRDLHLLQIAETPMSRLLDQARQLCWARLGEPERPEHPPRRYLQEHHGLSIEPMQYPRGGTGVSQEEQMRRLAEQHAADAEAQIEWEMRAAEQSAAWRARVEADEEEADGG